MHRVQQLTAQLAPQRATQQANSNHTSAAANSHNDSTVYDVAIVGLGAHGAATAYHLAKRGVKVLGLERFTLAHANGSSHGETRITRLAYSEHPSYVPLLRRSFALVDELECASSEKLFLRTGSLDVGPAQSGTFRGSLRSCQEHGLEHEIFNAAQLRQRYPAWNPPDDMCAVFQPAGGMLFPEKIVQAHARLARQAGATLLERTEVEDVQLDGEGRVIIHARTDEGLNVTYRARRVLLAAGAWLPTLLRKTAVGRHSPLLRSLADQLTPERQVVTWYEPAAGAGQRFDLAQHPVWVCTYKGRHFYGFPLLASAGPDSPSSRGVKIGCYHHAEEALNSEAVLNDLETRQRTTERDRLACDEFMRGVFAGSVRAEATDPVLHQSTCIFTNTPDEHFVLDLCPDAQLPQVSVVSACSGHGFKFAPVIGEAMARLLTEGREAVERDLPVAWLDCRRLFGLAPPINEGGVPARASEVHSQ